MVLSHRKYLGLPLVIECSKRKIFEGVKERFGESFNCGGENYTPLMEKNAQRNYGLEARDPSMKSLSNEKGKMVAPLSRLSSWECNTSHGRVLHDFDSNPCKVGKVTVDSGCLPRGLYKDLPPRLMA
ncbi:Uncharacterized protein Fot_32553 [Forsythia ovata]|uniref:Uncharacterized protein n=1 Tax=Forsythia ovata TaxID=205694 RepID=A0ABD1T859_9LAMI